MLMVKCGIVMTEEKHDNNLFYILYNMPTGNSKFPWLDQKYVMEIEQRTANVPAWVKEIMQQKMYSDFYAQQKREEEQAERMAMKNQITQKELEAKSDEKVALRITNKKATLADGLRNFYKLNLSDWDDDTLISKFTSWIKNWDKMYIDYLNGDNNDIMVKTGLFWDVFKQLNEKQKVGMTPNVSNTVTDAQNKPKPTNLTSTSHFDDPEYAAYYINNAPKEYKQFIEESRKAWQNDTWIASVIDGYKLYTEQLQKYEDFENRDWADRGEEVAVGIPQGFVNFFANAYNNLFANNPSIWLTHGRNIDMDKIQFTDDLLGTFNNYWDLRAESWWTKTWEFGGEMWANLLLFHYLPIPWQWVEMESLAESALENWTKWVLRNVWDRLIYWAWEWAMFGELASMGQENVTWRDIAINTTVWAGLGTLFSWIWAGGNALKYKNILKTLIKEWDKEGTIRGLLDMYNRWIKPTSQWVKTNTQLQQYNDDAMWAVESIIKNKNALKYVDASWEETFGHLPRTVDEFSQAIKQTKQSIYDRYTAIAKEAWQTTNVDTSDIVKDLRKQLNNKEWRAGQSEATIAKMEKWIRDLEELNNTMSIEWAQAKVQELNQKIQAFLKNQNPNDVSPNAVDGLVLNGLKKSIDDAIEKAGLDSEEYIQLRNIYRQLKSIESDVNHRAVVYGRQNPQSLVDSMSDLQTIDAIADIFANPIWWTVKLLKTKAFKTLAKDRNNSNKIVENMFKDADDTISKTDTLKSQTQIANERTQRQQYDIRKSRQQRLEEANYRRTQMERARQEIAEKQAQQEAAYQEYLRSKWVWSDTNALPWKRSEYNSIVNDNTPVAIDPSGNPVRWYKEIQEIPQQSRYSNEEIWSRFKPDKDSQDALNDFLAILPKYEQKGGNYTLERLMNNMDNYNSAKVEYDWFLDKMASEVNGTALKPPLKIANSKWEINWKWVARALQKANKKADWVEWVTDIVRWTTAVKDEAWMQAVKEWIQKNWIDTDPKFKFDDKFSNPTNLWYKDMSFIYTTKNWVKAEVQINTPNMMAAKEWEEAIKMGIISEPEYNALIKKVGEEWGKGHKYYEEWRKLNDWIAEGSIKWEERVVAEARMAEIEKESTAYYQKFEKAGNDGGLDQNL